MAQQIKSLKVFLASPGDLGDERKAAKVAVEEINSTLAVPLGFMFQLIGWEDTTSAYGRPQETINKEIKECDIFVGMVWERWGTPPDNEGRYQSGFEEEYELALSLKEKHDKPDISLFLKEINDRSKNDPGEQLKRVLEFRNKLNSEKKVLYKEFRETSEFSSLLRRLLADRVHELFEYEREKEQRKTESTQSTKSTSEDQTEKQKQAPNKRILPENSEIFLKDLLQKNDDPNVTIFTPYESAKLRLISRVFRTPQNDDSAVGVHDINILYESGHNDFSLIENFQLLQDALSYYTNDNVPLWKWYTFLTQNSSFDLSKLLLKKRTTVINEAFKAMRLIGAPITETENLSRSEYIEKVFLEHNEDSAKGFLDYLSDYGQDSDLPLIKKVIDESNFSLKKSAINCYLRIIKKSSREKALCYATDLDAKGSIVEELFEEPNIISEKTLKKCLQSQSEDIVYQASSELLRRGKIDEDEAKQLTENKNINVRYVGVLALCQNGELLDRETANSIIGDEEQQSFWGLSPNLMTNFELKRNYYYYYLRNIDNKHLSNLVDYEPLIFVEPLIIYFERNARTTIEEIRDNIDNRFEPAIKSRSRTIIGKLGDKSDIVKKAMAIHTSQEPEITRKLLSILIKQNNKEDLPRLRETLSRPDIAITAEDIKFLERNGEWEDIKLLNEKFNFHTSQSIYLDDPVDQGKLTELAAKCILKIAKNRENELFVLELDERLLRESIINIQETRLKNLNKDSIFLLLNHEDDEVRRFTTCKLCKVYSKKMIEDLEKEYFERFEQRFYNVIHWLDFGKSVSKECLRESVKKVLNREITW